MRQELYDQPGNMRCPRKLAVHIYSINHGKHKPPLSKARQDKVECDKHDEGSAISDLAYLGEKQDEELQSADRLFMW